MNLKPALFLENFAHASPAALRSLAQLGLPVVVDAMEWQASNTENLSEVFLDDQLSFSFGGC